MNRAIGFAAVLSMFCTGAWAQQVNVTGNFGGPTTDGGSFAATFSCFGTPTCTGTYNGADHIPECPNTRIYTADITITNLDLSHAGSLSGNVTITGADGHAGPHNAGETCPFSAPDATSHTIPYTATWSNGSGTLVLTALDDMGQPFQLKGTINANVPGSSPVFPMTVSASVGTATATGTATIQPRTQDAGSTENVYVFTHAPSNLVSGASPKAVNGQPPIGGKADDAVVCVLAQVTSDGHLVAASASSMQAALSGVLSSQGQAVQILNNVPTPNIAGATVYVGYGTSAAAMLSSGVYQAALVVPGAIQCQASLAAAPAPASPAALSGLWWNASESGWGIHFTQRGKNLFAAWYTYDTAGNPKWYVAPNCGFTNAGATSGSCTSTLYEVTAAAYIGHDFNPNTVQATQAGSLTLTFTDSNNASMNYTVGSNTRTVAIVRQPFSVAQTAPPAVDYTDLWWNPNESGWGMAMAQQFGNIFLAWYVYDTNGKPFWYVAPACSVSGSSCSGTLYRTTGPAFGPPLDPTKVQAFAVGVAVVSFVDANNAVLSYTVDNVSATKVITRQLF
jgi:hypothetical protein